MTRRLLGLAVVVLACSRTSPDGSVNADDAHADAGDPPPLEPEPEPKPEVEVEPEPEPEPEVDGCVVQATIPTEAQLGRYPAIDVVARPAIPYGGGPNPPRLVITLQKPDGELVTSRVELVYPPVCAFCLPAKGSGGCEHDCRWEPFVRSSFGISRELTIAGDYRVSLALENHACTLRGGEATLRVRPRD